MSINKDELREELKRDEGIVYAVYLDPLGYPTFGIGHLIKSVDPEHGLPVGTPISRQRVYEVFEQDLQIAIKDCYHLFGEEFDEWPKDVKHVLINMMFNLGRMKLRKFVDMIDALHKRNWPLAALEGRDSLWYQQVTNRAERLMKRLESI